MARQFRITQRHYKLIIKQTLDHLPQEAGGFVGGSDDMISAVLPTHNQYIGNRTDTFGITSDDIQRAHAFFKQHGLSYFGPYHSHPKGIAYPSPEDIRTGQRFHFIVSLKDPETPVFAAYEIIHNRPHAIQLIVVSDQKFQAKDLQSVAQARIIPPENDLLESARQIGDVLDHLRQEKKPEYQKLPPKLPGSDFSAIA